MPPIQHYRLISKFSPRLFSPPIIFTANHLASLVLCLLLVWSNQATAQDADGSLIANATISEPIALPTTATSVGAAVDIFDFDIVDGGSTDGLALAVTQIVLHTSGSAGNGEYNKVTWRLNGPDASNVTGSFAAGASTITFSGLSISVANSASETYTVNAYYSGTGGLQDNDTFILSIDGDTDLTLGAGTTMAATTPVTNGSGSILQITATQLVFTTQPAPLTPTSASALDFTTDPIVEARDANGLKDVDFTDTVTLTENGAGTATYTNNSVTAVAGIATFTGLTTIYTATADGQTFALQADDTAGGAEGDLAAVASSNLTADVVATQLILTTQPAPLSPTSASALDFSTDPIIEARDANGIKDTDFTDTVTLTENGAGTATYTNNSVTAVAGIATFTGLTTTYTATADGQTFALQADDTAGGAEGDLGTVDSSNLTADVVATQLVLTTQPAPLSATSGSALDFSTDPIVEARDANGIKDTDFTDTVTLTENGAGTATYTNNSVTAVAGIATFTGLTTTYTATADGQTFALQADDTAGGAEGDLGTVNSSNLTADVVATSISTASISFSNLSTYADGTPKTVEISTTPANLAVSITYNGSTNAPRDPGTYQVIANVTENNYTGSANATFVIEQRTFAPPTIGFKTSTNSGLTPLRVHFTDTSTGHIVERVLETFDDHNKRVENSTEPVTATYSKAGIFEALLFIRAHGGKAIGRIPITAYELTTTTDAQVAEGQPLSLELLDRTAAAIIDIKINTLPQGATLHQGTLHWTPSFSQAGTYTLGITAIDAQLTRQNRDLIITVIEAAPPAFLAPSTALRFGEIRAGEEAQRSFYVTNPSNIALEIETLSCSNPAFCVVTPMPQSIAPGDSAAIVVQFKAEKNMPAQQTNLSGISTMGEFSVPIQGRSLWAGLTVGDPTVDFQAMPIGDTCIASTEVTNTGTLSIELDLASKNSAFTVSPGRFSLAPGSRQDIEIAFSPTDDKGYNTSLVLAELVGDTKKNIAAIAVVGRGTQTPSSQLALNMRPHTGEAIFPDSPSTYVVELTIADAPAISGWSARLSFDPEMLSYVPDSFAASNFLPSTQIQIHEEEGSILLSGTTTEAALDDGLLGTLSFTALATINRESTALKAENIRLYLATGSIIEKEVVFVRLEEPAIREKVELSLEREGCGAGDFNCDQLVDLNDFFSFIDVFGQSAEIAGDYFDLDRNGTIGHTDLALLTELLQYTPHIASKLATLTAQWIPLPEAFALSPNYPNPFNSQTAIQYALPADSFIRLDIFNTAGQRIRTLAQGRQTAGRHQIIWDGRDALGHLAASGVYLYLLQGPNQRLVRQLTLIK